MKTRSDKSWSMVVMLCATATAGYMCRVNVSTAGPLLMNEFGLSQIAMGRIFSAFLLGYALFSGSFGCHCGPVRSTPRSIMDYLALGTETVVQTFVGSEKFQNAATHAMFVFMICRFLLGITASPTYPGSAQGAYRDGFATVPGSQPMES